MDERRTILTDVAEGRLSPEDAAERLDALRGEPRSASREQPPLREAQRASRVRVASTIGMVSVVGDASVAEAKADAAHTTRYENGTLIIESADDPDIAGVWSSPHTIGRAARRVASHGSPLSWGLGLGWGGIGRRTPFTVRMNPDLPLEVDLTAGSLAVTGVRSSLRLDVGAGTLRLDGVTGPLTLTVTSGGVAVRGRITQGDSRIRCDLGKVAVQLDPGSSVQVTGRAHLGRVLLPGKEPAFGAGLIEDTAVVGDGDATLEIETSAGGITVTTSS
ncbi:MAG: SHOCT-like domain-containing protein [Egibacteraceae bacterium]